MPAPPTLHMARSWRRAGIRQPIRLHAVYGTGRTALCGMTLRPVFQGQGGPIRPPWDPEHTDACPACKRLAAREA